MKLFLTTHVPAGQKVNVVDPVTMKIKQPGYLLFPDKCDEDIPDDDAKVILRQNPEAISDKPMSKTAIQKQLDHEGRDFSLPRGFTMTELLARATIQELEAALRLKRGEQFLPGSENTNEAAGDFNANVPVNSKGLNLNEFVIDEKVEETVKLIASMKKEDLKNLKPADIAKLGADLGIKIPSVGIKKTDAINLLDNRAKELASRIDAPRDTGDEKERE